MTRKAKTCFIYVRVSTKMQVENGESIEAQLYDLRQYAKRENLRILHEYIDDGYSGKNITGRPHFQEMIEEIKSGVHVDYVLVFKLSRFGRNAADALSSLQFMQDYGTNLVCVKDGINSEAQMGKMMIAFMSAFAEMERENILVQTMAGREQKAREGKWNGGQAPFGYRLVKDEKGKGHLEIDEDEAEIVRIIFREYTKNGKGVHAIASWLNTQGYRKKIRGNSKYEHFAPGTVKNIIRNPVYAGKIAFGRRRTTPVKGERNVYHMVKQDNFDIYEGEHDAIIDEATWDAAQKRLAEDSHPFPEAKPDGHTHLLTGMLVCPVCERNMIANVSRGKRKKDGTIGKTTYAYTCKYSKKQFGHDCTFTRQFKQEYIDREVIEVISRAAHSAVFEERVREELDAAVDIEKLEADVARIGKALENNGAARRMLSRQLDALDASDRSYERKYEDMQARLDKLYDESADIEDALDAAEAKLESAKEKQVTTARVYEMLDEFQEKFDTYDPAKQKEILQQVVERVEIDPDANPKKGDAIVKRVRFKCPVSFYRTLPEEAYDVLGINEFNRLETTEYTPDGNSRVDGNHDDTFCIQKAPARAYYALDTALVTFNLADETARQDTVSDATIQSVHCKDDLVAFAAANIENSSDGINNYPFSITVARNTGDGFETLWTYEDTFAVTVSTRNDTPQPFASVPKIVDILHCGEDLVLAAAGKKLYAFSLTTGEVVYEQEFAASIVAAQPCFVEEDRYAISLALSDATLNVISPLFDVTTSTDSSTTAVPFTLNGAWLGADNYGNLVAYLHTADRLNRIYCYLFRPFCDSTVAEEFTLDELLAYARQAVGQS